MATNSMRAPRAVESTPVLPRARWTFSYGAGAGVLAAAVGLAMLSAVTVLLWATGPQTTEPTGEVESRSDATGPFRTAAAFWVLGHRGAVEFPGTEVRLAPLGLAAGFALVAVKAAVWATRAARAHELVPAMRVAGGFAAGSGLAAYGAARFTEYHELSVSAWSALSAVVPFALVAALAGGITQTYEWARFAAPRRDRWRPVLRSALAAGLVLLAGGAVVVAASLFARTDAGGELFTKTGGGFSGAFGALLLCLALLPTAACWAVAFAAGPGFALGTDASVALNGVESGALPTLPLAAALPGPGGLPWYGWLPPILVVLAGVAAGWHHPARPVRLRCAVGAAAAAGSITGIGAALVLAFSSGDAGGRLSPLGPNPLLVGAMLVGELAAIATATALLRHLTTPRAAVSGRLESSPAVSGRLERAPAVSGRLESSPAVSGRLESSPAVSGRRESSPAVVPAPRLAVDVPTEEPNARAADDPLSVDDSQRFAHIPLDAEDLEDTQELPIVFPAVNRLNRLGRANRSQARWFALRSPHSPVRVPDLAGRFGAAKAALTKPDLMKPDLAEPVDRAHQAVAPDAPEHPDAVVARARLAAELSLPV